MGPFDLHAKLSYIDARYYIDLSISYTAVYLANGQELRIPISVAEGERLLEKIVEVNGKETARPTPTPESEGSYLGIPPPAEPTAPFVPRQAPAPPMNVADLAFDQSVPANPGLVGGRGPVPRRTISQDSAGNPSDDSLPDETPDTSFSGGDDLESF